MTHVTEIAALLSTLSHRLLPLGQESGDGTDGSRRAAVLILLYPRGDEIYFPLTVRPDSLSRHPGQISLPGGGFEAEDMNLASTALRETREELGVDPSELELLGRLPTFRVAVSGFIIDPFVAWSPAVPALSPDPAEVAEVLEFPVRTLLDPKGVREEIWKLRGERWRVTYYHLAGRQIWGATARILFEFAARLHGLDSVEGHGPGSVIPAPQP